MLGTWTARSYFVDHIVPLRYWSCHGWRMRMKPIFFHAEGAAWDRAQHHQPEGGGRFDSNFLPRVWVYFANILITSSRQHPDNTPQHTRSTTLHNDTKKKLCWSTPSWRPKVDFWQIKNLFVLSMVFMSEDIPTMFKQMSLCEQINASIWIANAVAKTSPGDCWAWCDLPCQVFVLSWSQEAEPDKQTCRPFFTTRSCISDNIKEIVSLCYACKSKCWQLVNLWIHIS